MEELLKQLREKMDVIDNKIDEIANWLRNSKGSDGSAKTKYDTSDQTLEVRAVKTVLKTDVTENQFAFTFYGGVKDSWSVFLSDKQMASLQKAGWNGRKADTLQRFQEGDLYAVFDQKRDRFVWASSGRDGLAWLLEKFKATEAKAVDTEVDTKEQVVSYLDSLAKTVSLEDAVFDVDDDEFPF